MRYKIYQIMWQCCDGSLFFAVYLTDEKTGKIIGTKGTTLKCPMCKGDLRIKKIGVMM
jgi:hypothetical protein